LPRPVKKPDSKRTGKINPQARLGARSFELLLAEPAREQGLWSSGRAGNSGAWAPATPPRTMRGSSSLTQSGQTRCWATGSAPAVWMSDPVTA